MVKVQPATVGSNRLISGSCYSTSGVKGLHLVPADKKPLRPNAIAFLGNYLPRKCGIATFTTHLCESISEQAPDIDCWVIAMNDKEGFYDYPARVRFEISQNRRQQYKSIADRVNQSGADVLCVQHEFGIFGGDNGSYLLDFLDQIQLPVIVTMHSVLKNPPTSQQRIVQQIADRAERLVVMGHHATEFLSTTYHIPEQKIVLIPHGIPNIEYKHPDLNKEKLGMSGHNVILSFGLLSPSKGIEYMVDAMPEIVRSDPMVRYLIVGNTHPHIKAKDGEDYRQSLVRRAQLRGVDNNIRFVDKFLLQHDLLDYISIADVLVLPYLNEAQITSGVLSYSLGFGRAIVSTPFWHAQEALANGRGILVPFKNQKALAKQISCLLHNDMERRQLQLKAYQYSRSMIWSEVAQRYLDTFEDTLAMGSLTRHEALCSG